MHSASILLAGSGCGVSCLVVLVLGPSGAHITASYVLLRTMRYRTSHLATSHTAWFYRSGGVHANMPPRSPSPPPLPPRTPSGPFVKDQEGQGPVYEAGGEVHFFLGFYLRRWRLAQQTRRWWSIFFRMIRIQLSRLACSHLN
jgi:hypothetical protein